MRKLQNLRSWTVGLLLLAANFSHATEPWPEEMHADARLNDVFFLDSDRGWAVGDRGTVLFTEDSGRTWRRRPVGGESGLKILTKAASGAGRAGNFYERRTPGGPRPTTQGQAVALKDYEDLDRNEDGLISLREFGRAEIAKRAPNRTAMAAMCPVKGCSAICCH